MKVDMYKFQQNLHTIRNSLSTAESFVGPNIGGIDSGAIQRSVI